MNRVFVVFLFESIKLTEPIINKLVSFIKKFQAYNTFLLF